MIVRVALSGGDVDEWVGGDNNRKASSDRAEGGGSVPSYVGDYFPDSVDSLVSLWCDW